MLILRTIKYLSILTVFFFTLHSTALANSAYNKCDNESLSEFFKIFIYGEWRYLTSEGEDGVGDDSVYTQIYQNDLSKYGSGIKVEIEFCRSLYCVSAVAIRQKQTLIAATATFHNPETYRQRGEVSFLVRDNVVCLLEHSSVDKEVDWISSSLSSLVEDIYAKYLDGNFKNEISKDDN